MFKTDREPIGQRARNKFDDQSQLFPRWLDQKGHALSSYLNYLPEKKESKFKDPKRMCHSQHCVTFGAVTGPQRLVLPAWRRGVFGGSAKAMASLSPLPALSPPLSKYPYSSKCW